VYFVFLRAKNKRFRTNTIQLYFEHEEYFGLSMALTDKKSSMIESLSSTVNQHLNKLLKYSQETETKSYVDSNGNIRQYRQSTERALLAQRKIFLRKKLGEGSFSSVREGFDLFHQHKVAIKVFESIR